MGEEIRDARGQRLSLSGAGRGEDLENRGRRGDCGCLSRVEAVQNQVDGSHEGVLLRAAFCSCSGRCDALHRDVT